MGIQLLKQLIHKILFQTKKLTNMGDCLFNVLILNEKVLMGVWIFMGITFPTLQLLRGVKNNYPQANSLRITINIIPVFPQ